MMVSPTTKVRDVALKMPEATRVFERLKIDYCCGGDQPLGDACASVGIELKSLERMLEDAAQNEAQQSSVVDFQSLSLAELIAHILNKHHVYTRKEMTRLEALIEKVVNAHGVNHPELGSISKLFQRLCSDLTPHMFKEEQILFPYVIELENASFSNRPAPQSCFGTVNNPVRMMMIEHDKVGDLLRELRAASSDYAVPADACLSYQTLYQALEAFEQDLHQHIHLENNILFPRAIELEGSRR